NPLLEKAASRLRALTGAQKGNRSNVVSRYLKGCKTLGGELDRTYVLTGGSLPVPISQYSSSYDSGGFGMPVRRKTSLRTDSSLINSRSNSGSGIRPQRTACSKAYETGECGSVRRKKSETCSSARNASSRVCNRPAETLAEVFAAAAPSSPSSPVAAAPSSPDSSPAPGLTRFK